PVVGFSVPTRALRESLNQTSPLLSTPIPEMWVLEPDAETVKSLCVFSRGLYFPTLPANPSLYQMLPLLSLVIKWGVMPVPIEISVIVMPVPLVVEVNFPILGRAFSANQIIPLASIVIP